MGDPETTTPSFLMGSHVLPTGSWRAGANFEPWQVFFLQVAGFLMFTSKGGDGGVVFWHLERCQELWLPIAMPSKARNAAEKRNLFLSLWLVVNLRGWVSTGLGPVRSQGTRTRPRKMSSFRPGPWFLKFGTGACGT